MAIRQEGNTYYGLSTDAKPTGAVLNGREFKEMDTGKKYLFDAENGEWLEQPEEGGGGGGGSSTLSGLTDVDISNPSDGQTLVYNATSGKWENGGGGGGGGGVLALHVDSQTGTLDKTWQEIYDQANAGAFCFIISPFTYDGITGLEQLTVSSIEDQTSTGNGYVVNCSAFGASFSAQTPNDYPSAPMG